MTTGTTPPADDLPFWQAVRYLPMRVWLVSAGILVNRAGNFLPVFIVLYVTVTHHSAWASGFVLGAAGLGNVLGNAIGGHLADRLGRRWTMTLSGLLTGVLTAGVPLVDPLPLLILLVFLVGTVSQIYRPAAAALLVDGLHHKQRLAAAGVFRFAMNIGAAIGGVLGGLLAATSYELLFYGNAAAALIFGVLTAVLVRDPAAYEAARSESESVFTEKVGYRTAFADRRLRRFLIMTFVAEAVYIQSTVGLPLHVSDSGLSPTSFGLLIGLNGLIVLVLELPITAAVSRGRPEYVLAVGNLLTGLGLAATAFTGSMSWLAVTVAVWTFGEMMYASMAAAYLGGLAPPHIVGRYQGMYGAAIAAGNGLGPVVGGLLYAANTGVFWALVAVAGVLSAQLCLPPLLRRRAGNAPSAPVPAEQLQPTSAELSERGGSHA